MSRCRRLRSNFRTFSHKVKIPAETAPFLALDKYDDESLKFFCKVWKPQEMIANVHLNPTCVANPRRTTRISAAPRFPNLKSEHRQIIDAEPGRSSRTEAG